MESNSRERSAYPPQQTILALFVGDDRATVMLIRFLLGGLLLFELANAFFSLPYIQFDNRIWLGLVLTNLCLWTAMEAGIRYARYGNVSIPRTLLWVGTAIVFMDALGNMFEWYASISNYDKWIHFSAGAASTSFVFYVLKAISNVHHIQLNWTLRAYLAVATTAVLGILFEAFEMVADEIYPGNYWLGSGIDTVTDLLMALFGSLAAVMLLYIIQNEKDGREEKN